MLKMVNISSERVDEKSRDESNIAYSQENEENVIEEIATLGKETKKKMSRSQIQIVIPTDLNHPPYPPSQLHQL